MFLHGDTILMNNDNEKIEYFINYFSINELIKNYNIVYDEEKPDLLFVSEHLYYGKNTDLIKKKFIELQKNNPITIFVAGECIEPDFNLFDYAIVFDRSLSLDDRVIRIPILSKFRKSIFMKKNDIVSSDDARMLLKNKDKFCNFIYSNSNAHFMRDKLFYEISKYKQVDSLGSHLRNVNEFDPKLLEICDWRLQSIKYKENYKFSIASENAQYKGYVSEKILTSLQAHTVPIYFGDKEVGMDINKEAFIDVNDYDNFEDLIEVIKKVDEDDELWCKYISTPWFTSEQLEYHKHLEEKYYDFLEKLFSSDIESLRRTAIGFHPDNFRKALYERLLTNNDTKQEVICKRTFIGRILNYLNRKIR